MAGYLGTKAVLLSTTAADVVGNAEIGGDLTVGGTFTSQGIDDNASATAMTLDASGNVLVGTATSPSATSIRQVLAGANGRYLQYSNTSAGGGWVGSNGGASGAGQLEFGTHSGAIGSETYSEAMRIDSSGNLLVGKTSTAFGTAGTVFGQSGQIAAVRSGNAVADFNRLSSDGDIVNFYKNGSPMGSIQADASYLNIGAGTARLLFIGSSPQRVIPRAGANAVSDNALDLGDGGSRFDDIYATNGTIQTSDANEKQQIASLTTAEMDAAKAISQLFKTFKWNDSVAEKGDAARTHAGVIAQEVEQAMTDAGLDAGDYAFFISSTWWETQTEVPAVEAVAEVLDDDGNVVTEAVEAKDAYTRTDTYETAEEAPEGATERTRKGIRYPELLAFVGAATQVQLALHEQRLADIETRLTALEGN